MRQVKLGKYLYTDYESSKVQGDLCRFLAPLPTGVDSDNCILSIVEIEDKKHTKACGELLSIYSDSFVKRFTVQYFTTNLILLLYLHNTLRNNKVGLDVAIATSQFPQDLYSFIDKLWNVWDVDDYVIVSSKDSVKDSVILDRIINLYTEAHAIESDEDNTMFCCVGTRKNNVLATKENIDSFNELLVKQGKSGYIEINKNATNYGELLEYISSFELSTIESRRGVAGFKVWLLEQPILLGSQEPPKANRRLSK